jgi:hypothetical protein
VTRVSDELVVVADPACGAAPLDGVDGFDAGAAQLMLVKAPMTRSRQNRIVLGKDSLSQARDWAKPRAPGSLE